jgi:cell shape-determining protein MreC
MRKAVEDLEDKLTSAQDEADENRSKSERLEKLNHS